MADYEDRIISDEVRRKMNEAVAKAAAEGIEVESKYYTGSDLDYMKEFARLNDAGVITGPFEDFGRGVNVPRTPTLFNLYAMQEELAHNREVEPDIREPKRRESPVGYSLRLAKSEYDEEQRAKDEALKKTGGLLPESKRTEELTRRSYAIRFMNAIDEYVKKTGDLETKKALLEQYPELKNIEPIQYPEGEEPFETGGEVMAERKTGLPVDPTSPPIAQIISPFVPMSYQVDRPYSVNTQEVDGGLIYSETPQKVSDPQFAVPPVITGGIEFFKQLMDDPTETAGGIATAIGEEIKAYPERQLRTALAGGETINPETGEIERYDPLGVPATTALGSAASIARTAGDGGTVLGIMAGRNAKDGGKKLDQFLAARDRGLDDRDNYAETQGYIEPSDGAFRFEIDTSNARLKEGLFEESSVSTFEGEPYQRLNISEFRKKEGRVPKLDEVFDFKELFEQYPELRSIDVEIVPAMSSIGGTKAAFDPVNNLIYLGSAPSKEMISNILHEVQHAVQHIEGFTPGSNTARYLPEGFSKKLVALDSDISKSSQALLDSKSGLLKKKTFQERADDAVGKTIYRYNLASKARNFFEGETDAYGYVDFNKFATPNELKELRKIAEKKLESDKMSSDQLKAGRMYRRQPGEVEARTVAKKFRKNQQGEFPLDVQDTDPIDYYYLIDKTMLNKPTAPRVDEKAQGGVVSLLDKAQNMNRGPKGVASLSSIARNMNRPMVS